MSKPALAAAGIIFIFALVAAVVYYMFRAVKSKTAVAEVPPPVPEDPLLAIRGRYDSILSALQIPHNAMTVSLVCNNYSEGGAARHYCWINNGEFMLFPLWESIVSIPGMPESADLTPREWRIPVDDVVCFAMEQGLPNRFVILQFKKHSEVFTLAFSEDAARVFAILFPEKDFSHLLEELYPKSSRNIRDIKENFISLKELREQDLITEDEYTAKKKDLLILM